MKINGTEVATVRWSDRGDGDPTDTARINLNELPNGDLWIVQQCMGPSTQESYGCYDYELSIQIARSDCGDFAAMLLSIAFENEATLFSMEELKLRCSEREIPFIEADRAIGLVL